MSSSSLICCNLLILPHFNSDQPLLMFLMFVFRTLLERWVPFQILADMVNNWWCFSTLIGMPTRLPTIFKPNHAYVRNGFCQDRLYYLITAFYFSICLWVICSSNFVLDMIIIKYCCQYMASKLWSSIYDYFPWKAITYKQMEHELYDRVLCGSWQCFCFNPFGDIFCCHQDICFLI